jgi:D-amino-acid dehydrogenase
MKVVVLGAGILGTASAWYLAKLGHEVTVIDRQPGAGLETSFANGGQISVSHAEPWANPSAPLKVLKWLSREDAPLLFRLRADPAQWSWGLQFLLECLPSRTKFNTAQILNLGTYSRACLQELRRETGIEYDHSTKGILHYYTDEKEWQAAIVAEKIIRALGADRRVVSVDRAVEIEPALAHAKHKLVGATFTDSDESGDAHMFTKNLAALCEKAGVNFRYSTTIEAIRTEGEKVAGVVVRDNNKESGVHEAIVGDSYVVCMGSYSALLLKTIGISIPVYPAKGYSATVSTEGLEGAPHVSVTDEAAKVVFSRFGNRLRIAGTAELTGYNTDLNVVRCEALVRRAGEMFPGAADYAKPTYWSGLRPATPSNRPLIGRAKFANLFLNTGHGTLGWTEGCGSGRALADIISGRVPEVDFKFLNVDGRAPAVAVQRPLTA